MARLLEDAEIDEWFQTEKEKLAEKLYTELQKGADFKASQQKFDVAFKKLFTGYEKKYYDAARILKRQETLAKPRKEFTKWRKMKGVQWTLFWKKSKEEFKKWRFEQEYKRLFKMKERKI